MKFLFDTKPESLLEARAKFEMAIKEDGMACPCCDRWGKVYGYRVNSTMVRALFWLFIAGKSDWINIQDKAPRFILRSKSLSTMKYWNLVERKPKEISDGKRFSGIWRITNDGIAFINRNLYINKKVFVFDDRVVGRSDEMVGVDDCLGNKFSYEELQVTRMIDERTY